MRSTVRYPMFEYSPLAEHLAIRLINYLEGERLKGNRLSIDPTAGFIQSILEEEIRFDHSEESE